MDGEGSVGFWVLELELGRTIRLRLVIWEMAVQSLF